MSVDTEALQPQAGPPVPNPWKFVPLLYVLQAIPVTIISDLSAVFYKDLGIPNELIATWTSIIALPWSLQFLLGPLVDLSAKKRKWVLMGQAILTVCLAIAPFFLLPGSTAFVASLIFLGGSAFVSAMTNIATDGFYMLAISKETQATFAGVQSASYRAGKLICMALVPFLVGYFMRFNPVTVQTGGNLYLGVKGPSDKNVAYLKSATFHLDKGELITDQGQKLVDQKGDPVAIPGTENSFNIQNGALEFGKARVPLALYQMGKVISDKPEEGTAKITNYPTTDARDTFSGGQGNRWVPAPFAWFVSLMCIALLYGMLMVPARKLVPEAPLDVEPSEGQRGQFRGNLNRTLAILAFYATAYFSVSAVWKLAANLVSGGYPGWKLPEKALFLGQPLGFSGVVGEVVQLLVCVPIAIALVDFLRKSLKGTEMGEAFSSFVRQSGIVPILCFLTFYRFSEAMVNKISVFFLKDDLAKGGLALSNSQFGLVKGTIGVAGMICGGIVGGIVAGKLGLKRGFWIIAVLMHLPILFYLYASLAQPSNLYGIGFIDFMDQFGYGLGYAGYGVYLMRVAQRGNHRTAHFAIGTGLGATFIALAGIVGGQILSVTGNNYKTTFLAALLFAIPGLLTLMFIPHDETRAEGSPSSQP